MRFIICIVSLFVAAHVEAQTVRINVVHKFNRHGLTRKEARLAVAAASRQILDETGVRLVITSWRTKNAKPVRVTPELAVGWGGHLVGLLGSDMPTQPIRNSRIVLVVAPRYRYQGGWWSAGRAPICGNHALAIVGNMERYGERSLLPAQAVVTHELGHALGAEHSGDTCQIMAPDAGAQLERCGWYEPFAPVSVDEIHSCMATDYFTRADDPWKK